MKVLRNRTLSLVLTFVMMMSMIPGAAFAVESDPIPPDITASDTTPGDAPNTVPADDVIPEETEENAGLFAIAGDIYVANSANGGNDATGDGSQANPFLTLGKALSMASGDVTIHLMSDIELTQSLIIGGDASTNITFVQENGATIRFTGTAPIGNNSGIIHINASGGSVSFDVGITNGTNDVDARLVYVAGQRTVSFNDVALSDGKMMAANANEGGSAIYVNDGGVVTLTGTSVMGNKTNGGGAIYVAAGGQLMTTGVSFEQNASKNGGAAYVADGGSAEFHGTDAANHIGQMRNNTATAQGGGLYLESGATVSVFGGQQIVGNTVSNADNNAYLADGANFITDGTTAGCDIGVTADPEIAYRLIAQDSGTDISVDVDGNEGAWHTDSGNFEIRYMVYNGVPGLYLYHKTVAADFENVDTLLTITGPNINGELVNYMAEPYIPYASKVDSTLTIRNLLPQIEQDYTITFTCDPLLYRIPTADIISVHTKGDATQLAYTYVPNFEAGTAILTIPGSVMKTLADGETVIFQIGAEKYSDLNLRMDGPLYTMTSSITGLSEQIAVMSESSKLDTTATYRVTRNNVGFAGVLVELYNAADQSIFGMQTTDADGRVSFTGLDKDANYYTILKYEDLYRVIERDVVTLTLSTLPGQTLSHNAIHVGETNVIYDSTTGAATITLTKADSTVTFAVEQASDTISFEANPGDATTAPAVLDMTSKVMPAGSNTYGVLATASLTGYTFAGWYTAADGGDLITAGTAYTTGVSPRVLYAHWTANTNTNYSVEHWVELAIGGGNSRYVDGTTATKLVDGVTYYLYETVPYADGVSDAIKDITGLGLTAMTDATLTWWTLDGFTAGFQADCKVLADGSSKFSINYTRNGYTISFQNNGKGTATNPDAIPSMTVKFGALIGTMPVTTLPGYEFGGWHKLGDTALVTATDVFNQAADMTLEAAWNTMTTAQWAIKIAVQDIAKHADGEYYLPGTYTDYKTVYLNNDGTALVGETDKNLTFAISSINALTITGFNYVGYADSMSVNGDNKTADTANAIVTVKPTDKLTAGADGKYNPNFDGGIVWLYYDRKISDISAEDGQGVDHEDEIIFGGDFTGHLPADPGKDGHDFVEWVDKDGNTVTEKTPADDYVTNPDGGIIDLTPKWTARQYNLTYKPGTNAVFVASPGTDESKIEKVPGGGYIDPNKVTYGLPIGVMPTASKTGYNFVSWLVDGKLVTSETVLDVTNLVISNSHATPPYGYESTRPMTAAFKAHEYTLVLDPGKSAVTGVAGSVSPSEVRVTFNGKVTGLPTPKLTGYKFVAWQLAVMDGSTVIKNGDVWTRAYTDGAKITLHATWIPETYRYTFDLNDTVGSTKASLFDTSIGYVEETFDSVYNGVFKVEAMRSGYTFMGWSLSKGGSVLTADTLVGIASDTTLYASWKAVSYDVKLVMNGATIADLTDNNLDTFDPTASYDAATDIWTIKVAFDAVYGELPIPTKTNATYHGYLADAANWPAKEGYGNTIHNQVIKSLPQYIDFADATGITLTAVMEPWFTFDPDGGKFDDGSTDSKQIIQSDITKLPVVVKPGYDFDGWVVDGVPGKIVTIDDIKSMTEPTVLKPRYSALITFNANGGTVNGKATDIISVSKMATLPGASKSGFDFKGWFTESTNGTQTSLTALQTANTPVTVYAHWTASSSGGGSGGGGTGGGGGGGGGGTTPVAKTFDVKFETTGGSAVATQTVKTGEKAVKPADPTKTFYKFDGWYGDKDLKTVFNFDSKITADITVYAKWLYTGPSTYLTTEHIAYIAGFGDGTVKPTANITRAEVAMIFYRLLNEDARNSNKTTSSVFTDVDSGAWYGVAIATLNKMGILNGRGNNQFDPSANITRAEFAAIASRFDTISEQKLQFTDVPASHWAYDEIGSAAAKGWVMGYGDGNFGPENYISRAETVTLINRVLGRDKITTDGMLKNLTLGDCKTWSDNSNATSWYYLAIQEAGNGHDHEMAEDTEVWTSLTDKTPGNT